MAVCFCCGAEVESAEYETILFCEECISTNQIGANEFID